MHKWAAIINTFFFLAWAHAVLGQPPGPIPVGKGAAWVYEANVRWLSHAPPRFKSRQVRWTTEVLDILEYAGTRVALVQGLPFDLAWYQEGKSPRPALLICRQSLLYWLPVAGLEEGRRLLVQFPLHQAGLLKRAELLLETPFIRGRTYGGAATGGDIRDGWQVEKEERTVPLVKGFYPGGPLPRYRLARRAATDEQLVFMVPGLGIERYTYRHHGTGATADAVLTEFRPGSN